MSWQNSQELQMRWQRRKKKREQKERERERAEAHKTRTARSPPSRAMTNWLGGLAKQLPATVAQRRP